MIRYVSLIFLLSIFNVYSQFIPQNDEEQRKWDLIKNIPIISHNHFYYGILRSLGINHINVISPSCRLLASSYQDGQFVRISIRTIDSGRLVYADSYYINGNMLWSPDSKTCAYSYDHQTIAFFRGDTEKSALTINNDNGKVVEAIYPKLFSENGKFLLLEVFYREDREELVKAGFVVCNIEENTYVSVFEAFKDCIYGPNSYFLKKDEVFKVYSITNDGSLNFLYSLNSDQYLLNDSYVINQHQHQDGLSDNMKKLISFSPNGKKFALISLDKQKVTIHQSKNGVILQTLSALTDYEEFPRKIESTAFSQTGKNFLVHLIQDQPVFIGSRLSNHVQMWDLSGVKPTKKETHFDSLAVYRMHGFQLSAFTSDDTFIYSVVNNEAKNVPTIRIERNSFNQNFPLESRNFKEPIKKIWFSPDGHYFFAETFDGTVLIWDSVIELNYNQLEALKILAQGDDLALEHLSILNTIPHRFVKGIEQRKNKWVQIFPATL